ncbi:DNA-directed RNA polymerase [Aphis craccivora]|uniref:DNA-directed RNA polymerase n=1 Tax=Aphis craccivora TaxID=307492 RepID=A0A6G0ZBP7_APHCR|nr:DNA-directed RNA polymerase [Aphis craccivora]
MFHTESINIMKLYSTLDIKIKFSLYLNPYQKTNSELILNYNYYSISKNYFQYWLLKRVQLSKHRGIVEIQEGCGYNIGGGLMEISLLLQFYNKGPVVDEWPQMHFKSCCAPFIKFIFLKMQLKK